jgi:hypothetical protein
MKALLVFLTLAVTLPALAQDQACDSSANANKLCVQRGKLGVCTYDVRCNIPVECSQKTLGQFCISVNSANSIVTYFRGICSTDTQGWACVTSNDAQDPILATPLELGIRE